MTFLKSGKQVLTTLAATLSFRHTCEATYLILIHLPISKMMCWGGGRGWAWLFIRTLAGAQTEEQCCMLFCIG